MKKNISLIIINIILLFIFNICNPNFSIATTTGTIQLKTDRNIIEKNEEIEITYNIEGVKTAAYTAEIYFDNNKFEFISGPENINIDENKIIIVWFDEQGGNNAKEGELGKLKFKAIEEGTSNFVINGEYYSEKGQLIETDYEALQIQIGREETILEKQGKEEQGTNKQTSNARLKDLRINQEGMVPNFKTDIYEYDITVLNNINDIEILAIPENPNSQIIINGNKRAKRRVEYSRNKYKFGR